MFGGAHGQLGAGRGCRVVRLRLFVVGVATPLVMGQGALLAQDDGVVNGIVLDVMNSVVGVWVETNYWLQFVAIDSVNLSDDSDLDVLAVILGNCHVGRRVVFLVAHQNVRDERALTRQEGDSELHCLAVPVLTVFSLVLDAANCFIKLMEKAELSAHAEVGDCQETKLFEDELSG